MKRILLQLDPDPHASVFDAVVAVDSGVDVLLRHAHVEVGEVRELVHGVIFTRGPKQLRNSAIFVGGRDVATAEQILSVVTDAFFGPMRVSVMLDANGANTTAASAVVLAARHLDLASTTATVLAATGSVGQRVCRLLADQGTRVRVCSRNRVRAERVVTDLANRSNDLSLRDLTDRVRPHEVASQEQLLTAVDGAQLIIAAGTAGVQLVRLADIPGLNGRVMIDLNAVPPVGVEGIDPGDSGTQRHGAWCYGALGVGKFKMSIHRAAIEKLFTANDLVLDAEDMLSIGQQLSQDTTV